MKNPAPLRLRKTASTGSVPAVLLVVSIIVLGLVGLMFTQVKRPFVSTTATQATSDTTPPTTPGTPWNNITWTAAKNILVWWPGSSDNVGVTGYNLYRDNVKIATVPATEVCRPQDSPPTVCYNDTGLTPSTTYTYSVEAFDAVGNVSASASGTAHTVAIKDLATWRMNQILGWVYGPNGEVVKAKVTLTAPNGKKKTYFTPYVSKNPEYGFPDLAPGMYSLLYQAPGLTSQTWNLEVFDDTFTIKLVYLQK